MSDEKVGAQKAHASGTLGGAAFIVSQFALRWLGSEYPDMMADGLMGEAVYAVVSGIIGGGAAWLGTYFTANKAKSDA